MSQISRLRDAEISNGNLINADDIDTELNQLVAESNSQDTRLTSIESNAMTIGGVKSFSSAPKMDQIDERSLDAGVTVDGVLHKDGAIRVPGSAGYAPSTNGDFGYDSTAHSYDVRINGVNQSLLHTGSNLDALNDVTVTSPASGQALVYNGSAWINGAGGVWTLLATATASASTSVDFTANINSTYDLYVIVGSDIKPVTDQTNLLMRVSEDGGSTWKSGAADYDWSIRLVQFGAGGETGPVSNNDNSITVMGHNTNANLAMSNTDAKRGSFMVHMWSPASTTRNKMFMVDSAYVPGSANPFIRGVGGGQFKGTVNAITGIRFLMSSGNISAGTFYLYGVRKA